MKNFRLHFTQSSALVTQSLLLIAQSLRLVLRPHPSVLTRLLSPRFCVLKHAFVFAILFLVFNSDSLSPQSSSLSPPVLPGQSATLLPDGRWLLVGGEAPDGSPLATASIWDPVGTQSSSLSTGLSTQSSVLNRPRAWHTATMLPDGTVLIFGGISSNGDVLSSPEVFDPSSQTFTSVLIPQSSSLSPRAKHTATLLTDGQVLIAGGIGSDGQVLDTADLFDPKTQSSVLVAQSLSSARRDHSATLLPDGTVLLSGGEDGNGNTLDDGDLFDPSSQTFTPVLDPQSLLSTQSSSLSPELAGSLPADGAVDVAVDAIVSLRFSTPLNVVTVNTDTVTLSGPNGIERIKVVPAEGGMLAFIATEQPLLPGSTYTVSVNGATDVSGLLLPLSGFTFTTQPSAISTQSSSTSSSESLSPQPSVLSPEGSPQSSSLSTDSDWEWKGGWKDGKPYSKWQDLSPLQANQGVTALAGQVLDLQGEPLADVTLQIEYDSYDISARTDESGRFLLESIEPGWRELIIDGRKAHNPKSKIENLKWGYGVFEYGLDIQAGQTNVLPFTIWLPKIDAINAVKFSSPTTSEVVVTTPKIPGLEVRIPPNTVIKDHEYKVVTEVSVTPIPVDRPPFPLPDVKVPAFFTIQPGGAYVYGPQGVRLIYPNYADNPELPGARFNFWHYDPEVLGWHTYGQGTVTENGKQIVPDPGVSIYEFTGAMINSGNGPAPKGPPPCDPKKDPKKCKKDGDPVDLASGLFVLEKTDLYLPDIMPLSLTRTYRQSDTNARPFGIGTMHPYSIFLWSAQQWQQADLILPDGGRVHYVRTSPGSGFVDAVFEHRAPDTACPTCVGTPTIFYGSKIVWNGNGWDLKLKDGTVYVFGNEAPLQSIRDRNGNRITLSWSSVNRFGSGTGNINKITSPNGRWVEFTYDASNRITQAKDNIGRIVTYEYDPTGRLTKATDPNGGITEYTYDTSSRMLTIKDARGIVFLTNEYDATTGRVKKQTQVDTSTYLFNYTVDANGNVTQTDVTDPRGNVRRVAFNSGGYSLTETYALGKPEEQTTSYEVQAGSNLLLSQTDALNRKTAYTYDTMGNVTSVTRLSGTPQAVTTTYTYEPTFNQVKTITDPLNHTWTAGYDIKGNLTSITNPLNQTTALTYNTAGQPISITDPLSNTTQFTYDFGDLVAFTDPLGNSTNRFIDAAGRLLSMTNPLGHLTLYDYDPLNRLKKVTDPLNGLTQFGYDPNGNLLSVVDAKNQTTAYTYNNMDRLATRKDPLLRTESYAYDLAGNMTQFTDRKTQATTFTYDALNRRIQARYADLSTTTYTYDKGNRLTQINDSASGLITRTYDGLNRLASETTPQGSVSYTYNNGGRRTTMTVAGQTAVNYAYDNANRLTQITQGSSIVSFAYDAAGRRTSLTLPNGVLVEYIYDAASRVTEIKYKKGAAVLGNLTYSYDKAGNRTKTGGTFARTGIPSAITSATYNAANQQVALGDKSMTFDNNGNLTGITDASGTTIYSWNARNQLTGISGPGMNANFVYDGLGRREKKTVNSNLTEFLYDGVNPVQETSGATVLANNLTGLRIDQFFARTDASGTSYYLPDVLGSTIALADSTGSLLTENSYEPFGATTTSGASSSNPFQFTGRENDGTGLYYYRNRYYHPQLQRFISEDPIEFYGGDVNLYAYVWNNPLRYIDPFGLFRKDPPEPKPCRTMNCEPKPPPPEPPCKTPSECFRGPGSGGPPEPGPGPTPIRPRYETTGAQTYEDGYPIPIPSPETLSAMDKLGSTAAQVGQSMATSQLSGEGY